MLSFLTPEGAPNYRKLIISPKQVALSANGVMDDFFYLEITPLNFFLFDLILYVPVNNFSVTLGRVFLGYRINVSCSRTQCCDTGEA